MAIADRRVRLVIAALTAACASASAQQADHALWSRVQQERAAFVDTLRDLVSIESGSHDIDGLNRLAELIADRLRRLGGAVELVTPAEIYRMADSPADIAKVVVARFTGTGTRRILLLAHMDTVHERGTLARDPFRVEGGRAHGPGVADDKHGVALILHVLGVLNAAGFRDYGEVIVLVNGDEEVSSPGSRALITKLASEVDAVLSCEGSSGGDRLRLATSGIGAATLTVTGVASHAGSAPEQGRNALYELAHQVLQLRDLSDAAAGLTLNWTIARAGSVRNVIPATAHAMGDVRYERAGDFDRLERRVREIVANQLVPGTTVEVSFERRRPPLAPTSASRRLAAHAQRIYAEIGRTLEVEERPTGGGTDAAFAALGARGPVIEGFGLVGGGAHAADAEWVDLESIAPRLYLLARLIIDIARGTAPV
ncbi:MAG TPA: glutamate carboxypeptidase [Vicinamibacterales bacterium]|nr:glutamate carboxypeptidase [Vicinamibacterales bacterium]